MPTCEVISLDGMDDDTISKLLRLYVKSMSTCAQEQFDDYYYRSRSAGMSELEAVKHGLIMGAFNEMVTEAIVSESTRIVNEHKADPIIKKSKRHKKK